MRALSLEQQKLQRLFASAWLSKWYFFWYIPSLFFWRAKIESLDSEKCLVSVPFNHWNKNPFRSIYFGTLAGAAELSTGALCLLAAHKQDISFLVTQIQGNFFKKATGRTTFHCLEGDKVFNAIEKAIESGEAQTVDLQATGYSSDGQQIAVFVITWSMKIRGK